MGWVWSSEATIDTVHGEIHLGSEFSLPAWPARFDVICQNLDPFAIDAADVYICLGVICTVAYSNLDNYAPPPPDGTHIVWVTFEQQQDPPGTPFGDGQWYLYNGIGNTLPPDSGGYVHASVAWNLAEFQCNLNGTAPLDPEGMPVSISITQYIWDEGAFADYDALTPETGDPGDPGYLYGPDSIQAIPSQANGRNIAVEWTYSNPGEQDGFAIFNLEGPEFPDPVALIPNPDLRSYAFPDSFLRNTPQIFGVTAYNATKRSDMATAVVDPIILELAPEPGIMPSGLVGTPYILQFTASNMLTEEVATYAVSAGALPDGLTLNAATGLVSGTPTLPGDYNFEIIASSPDVTDSFPTGSWNLNIQLSTPIWEMDPSDGSEVEVGETIVITGPSGGTVIGIDEDGKVIPLPGPGYEAPYRPSDECSECWDDCPECSDCAVSCAEDLLGNDCQDCMEACLECLAECLEDLMEAEECQETTPGTTITVYIAKKFYGTVPLGDLTILSTEASGIYKFTVGKTNDTIYTAERDGTTYDVKIPNPGGTTGFFKA